MTGNSGIISYAMIHEDATPIQQYFPIVASIVYGPESVIVCGRFHSTKRVSSRFWMKKTANVTHENYSTKAHRL
jgi:hypothetical protein